MPQARKSELIVEELPDETLVYDLKRHRAYCLNRTAALVWRHCDGKTSVEHLSRLLEKDLNIPADEEIVWLALARLQRARLLSGPVTKPEGWLRYSRRELARRLGLVGGLGVLLPVVLSILAPTAQAAATCVSSTDCKNDPSLVGSCCCSPNKICLSTGKCLGAAC